MRMAERDDGLGVLLAHAHSSTSATATAHDPSLPTTERMTAPVHVGQFVYSAFPLGPSLAVGARR